MPARKKSQPSQPSTAQQRWSRLMNSRIPLLDALGFNQLDRHLLAGDPRAAGLLASGLDSAYSPKIQASIRSALKRVTRASCIDALWAQALRSRSAALLEILLHIKQAASGPAEVRAFSLLKLNRLHLLEDAPPDLVLPLIQACDDPDIQIAAAARHVIGHLQKDDALDILCAHWARTRDEFLSEVIRQAGYLAHNPLDVRVLTALKLNQPDQIDTTSAEVVGPLIQASRDADGGIAASADYLLRHALSGAALTEFCLRWSRTRDTFLEAILLGSLLLPRQPPPLRLLCALKLDNLEIAQKCPPRNLDVLLTACSDVDATIQANARAALRNLGSIESREALCQRFLQDGNEEARMAAMDAGFQPAASEQRALFLFLTAQWRAYETLDFDRRLLRALYDTATPDLRQRLARTVQSSGRIQYLSILTGLDDRQRAAGMEDGEAGLVVQMLAQAQNWERLWRLAQEFPLARSVEILRLLLSNNWTPSAPEERALFQRLAGIAALPLSLTPRDAADRLPPAVPLATLKIHGRVNNLSFAPDRPILALACGNRKVVLWDYQKAEVVSMLAGFDHSVGQVVCLPEGALACAERTNGTSECAIILLENERRVHLGAHAASVTALLPMPDGNLLSAGRDDKVILWERATHRKIGEMAATEWPRCATISSDGRLAALLGEHLQLVELPSLHPLNDLPQVSNILPRVRSGVARCAAFAPGTTDLLSGQANGQVVHYLEVTSTQRRQKRGLLNHAGAVVGMAFLPERALMITAGAEGELHFLDWPSGAGQHRLATPLPNLTSLEVSPDGNSMATGCADNAFVLWDLRTRMLPPLLALPLAHFQPQQLATIESFSGVEAVAEPVRNSLCYLAALLQHRYRFTIQIAEMPFIQPGEFDILVDETGVNSG